VGTHKVLRISFEEQLLTEEKLRKFVKQQLEEKNKKIISLKKKIRLEIKLKKSEKNCKHIGYKPVLS
jgi:hypothetical protein